MKRFATIALVLFFALCASASAHSARDSFQQIWKQDRAFLGTQDDPAPRMVFGAAPDGIANGTNTGLGGIRTIYLGYGTQLALKKGTDPGVRFLVEHEFARVFQDDTVMLSSEANTGSGVANAVANRLAHFRNTGRGNPADYLHAHLPYWGQNPQTILWPVH